MMARNHAVLVNGNNCNGADPLNGVNSLNAIIMKLLHILLGDITSASSLTI